MTKGDFTKVTFKNGIMTKAGMLVAFMLVFGFLEKNVSLLWEGMSETWEDINNPLTASPPLFHLPIWPGQAQPYWFLVPTSV